MTATLDCVIVADLLQEPPLAVIGEGLAQSLACLGYRHAWVHCASSASGAALSSCQRSFGWLGSARIVDLLDPLMAHQARLAILLVDELPKPELLGPLSLDVSKALVCLTRPPASSGLALATALSRSHLGLQAVFGSEPLWTATDARIRATLQLALPTLRLPPPLHAVVPGAADAIDRTLTDRPIRSLGRHWLAGSHPSDRVLADLASALEGIVEFSPRFMAEPDLLRRLWQHGLDRGASLESWQAAPYSPSTLAAWLVEIDLFLATREGDDGQDLPLEALQAIAQGAIVIGTGASSQPPVTVVPVVPPDGIVGFARLLADDALERARWRGLQAHWLRDQHGPLRHRALFSDLIGAPARRPLLVTSRRLRQLRYVLFISGNGVGMGHLTRQLAVARRLPEPLRAYFLSLSPAAGQVEEMGFPIDYAPSHTLAVDPSGEVDLAHWNSWLDAHVLELMTFIDAAVVVFDGNRPYRGLLSALARAPERARIWVRRGLWQAGADPSPLALGSSFDFVVEPGDLAAAYDRGPTRDAPAHRTPPVRLLDHNDILERQQARAALGLDPHRPAVLLQLGGRNNFDYDTVERVVVERLRPLDIQMVAAEWLMREDEGVPVEGLRRITTFPLALYHKAFDFAVAAAGYNAFHELLANRIPTIFVPNENPSMDDQLARTAYALDRGLGLAARAAEPYALTRALQRMLEGQTRLQISRRCAGLDQANGATEIAGLIEAQAFGLVVRSRLQDGAARYTDVGA